MITVGLRVDVDTLRGTRYGVPALVDLLDRHQVKASFFMSVGPDNMGRHLWRLLRLQFLLKMLRSNAASLYGWDILLCGTLWPGRIIGKALPEVVRLPCEAGHETGLHAWDHHGWQTRIDRYSTAAMRAQIAQGYQLLGDILGEAPRCSAVAGWRCNDRALMLKEEFGFRYNSDCRGTSVFRPQVEGRLLTLQVPVTAPTYDEVIGNPGIDNTSYNDYILDQFRPDRLNVYTIHAEVEGIVLKSQFDDLLAKAKKRKIRFCPLGALPERAEGSGWGADAIVKREMPGREGWLAWQASAVTP